MSLKYRSCSCDALGIAMWTSWSEGICLYSVADHENSQTTILQEITLMERQWWWNLMWDGGVDVEVWGMVAVWVGAGKGGWFLVAVFFACTLKCCRGLLNIYSVMLVKTVSWVLC